MMPNLNIKSFYKQNKRQGKHFIFLQILQKTKMEDLRGCGCQHSLKNSKLTKVICQIKFNVNQSGQKLVL